MKIIIVSCIFDDQRRIGAKRPRAFAREFKSIGHEVTVVTRGSEPGLTDASDELGVRVIRVGPSRLGACVEPRLTWIRARATTRLKQMLRGGIGTASSSESNSQRDPTQPDQGRFQRAAPFARFASQAMEDLTWTFRARRNLAVVLGSDRFDVLLSSYGPLGSLWLGRALIRMGLAGAWACDLRDVMGSPAYPETINQMLNRVQRSSVQEADLVTVVSMGQREMLLEALGREELAEKIHVIPNGFTPDPSIAGWEQPESKEIKLLIAYTGQLYYGRRDVNVLFHALADCICDGSIPSDGVEFHYAGGNSDVVWAAARHHMLEHIIVDHRLLSFPESQALQHRADLLVVLSWNTHRERGVLTGKFPEYLAARKPIVALIRGEIPRAELAELVREMQLGFVYEESRAEADFVALKVYMADCWERRASGRSLEYAPREDLVSKFEYKNIARQLSDLFTRIQ